MDAGQGIALGLILAGYLAGWISIWRELPEPSKTVGRALGIAWATLVSVMLVVYTVISLLMR